MSNSKDSKETRTLSEVEKSIADSEAAQLLRRQARSSATQKELEWELLLERIARHSKSQSGRLKLMSLEMASGLPQPLVRQRLLTEALELAAVNAIIPAGNFDDLGSCLERIQLGAVASEEELAQVRSMLEISQRLKRFARENHEEAPTLAQALETDSTLADPLDDLREALSDEGVLLDHASEGLLSARADVRKFRKQIQRKLAEVIGRYREALQDGFYAERDGRYVLPVRADAPFRVEGTILGSSSSGATLYVEPQEIAPLGNQLRNAEFQVDREKAKVLARLSQALKEVDDDAIYANQVCVRADVLQACVAFAVLTHSRVIPVSSEALLQLKEARHPLLAAEGIEVVANDLAVSAGKGLVISGPNAGGKTVALKTLGLMAMMQSAGLALPVAQDSEVGFFDSVYCDIGDDQSLMQSLSTFSGHVTMVREIVEMSTARTLVLLDELMGGTDPSEGAALAIATSSSIVESGAALVVTTHYEALKDFSLEHADFQCAAVGFNFEEMAPTFKVEMGRPGASSALIVAQKFGLPRSIVQQAERILPEVDLRRSQNAVELEQLRADTMEEKRQLQLKVQKQEALNRQVEAEKQRLIEARRKDLEKEGHELRAGVRAARAELRQLRAQLKAQTMTEVRQLEKQVDQISNLVSLNSQVEQAIRPLKAPEAAQARRVLEPQPFRIGDLVSVSGLNTTAEVIELPKKGKVRIAAGALKMQVQVSQLTRVEVKKKAKTQKSPKASRERLALKSYQSGQELIRSQDTTLDLRGERVEEALGLVDVFVDELLQRQEPGGFLLHGHGTGALKDAIRQHARAHFAISESRAAERDEGGDAFTLIWLN